MNNIRSAAAVTTVLVAGVGTIAALTATDSANAGTAQTSSSAQAETFTLHAHRRAETNIDLGHTGFSAGDQDLFIGSLTRNGTRAGRLVGSCTNVRVGKSTADQLCDFVLRLHHSQITAIGSVSSTEQGPGIFTLPITGGTGHYQSAAGQIAVTATNGGTFPITVSLR